MSLFTATQHSWKSRGRLLSLALLGGMTCASGVGVGDSVAHATSMPHTYTWLTLHDGWLCRTWSHTDPAMLADPDHASVTAITTMSAVPSATGAAPQQQSAAQSQPQMLAVTRSHAASATATTMVDYQLNGATYRLADGAIGVENTTTGENVHCTSAWHVDGAARLTSDMPEWVPTPDGSWPGQAATDGLARQRAYRAQTLKLKPAPPTPVVARPPAPRQTNVSAVPSSAPGSGGTGGASGSLGHSGGYSAWAPVPGHPSYGMSDFAGDPWSQYFGVCTWYAWDRHQDEPLLRLGNAASWAYAAPGYGLHVGATPVVGATAVFQPGVEGAGGGGHAAHVEAVLGGGWFIISEMNFYVNGGGWGRVDWRYAYVGPGVSFIY